MAWQKRKMEQKALKITAKIIEALGKYGFTHGTNEGTCTVLFSGSYSFRIYNDKDSLSTELRDAEFKIKHSLDFEGISPAKGIKNILSAIQLQPND